MKSRLLVVVLALSACVWAQGSSPVISTRMSGGFADGTVSQNNSDTNQPLLIFDYSVSTATSSTFVYGGGYIPNSAFSVHSDNTASLNVDTSQLSGFFTNSCTTDFTTSTTSCSSGPLGVIQIDWKKNGTQSDKSTSEDWKTFPGVTKLHTQLNSELSSASATGSILGSTFHGDLGNIGFTTNSLFEIFYN